MLPASLSTCANLASQVGCDECGQQESAASALSELVARALDAAVLALLDHTSIEDVDIAQAQLVHNRTEDEEVSHAERLRIFALVPPQASRAYAKRRTLDAALITAHGAWPLVVDS